MTRLICLTFLVSVCIGCSANTALNHGPIAGTALGGTAGLLLKDQLGNKFGNSTLRSVVGLGGGAAMGYLGGKLYQKSKQQELAQKLPPKRVPYEPDQTLNQEIRRLRMELDASTNYGRGETKSWEERYQDHNPAVPYQGP